MTAISKIENVARLFKSYNSDLPSYLILFVTARCNARCKMCFYWETIDSASAERELSLSEYRRISRSVKDLFYLSIGGGEPTLRKDLADIVYQFYSNAGTRAVNISTNGAFSERTFSIVDSILRSCPSINLKVEISLDGIGAVHDYIRGCKGLFDSAMNTYHLLSGIKNSALAINIATTYSGLNRTSIYGLIDFVANELHVNDHTLSYVRGDVRDQKARDVTPHEYRQVWRYLSSKRTVKHKGRFSMVNKIVRRMYRINQTVLEKDEMVIPCLAAKKFLTIDQEGNVFPCELIDHIHQNRSFMMGNLREVDYDLNQVLCSTAAKDTIAFIEQSKCHCTFECANMCNIAFSKRILLETLLGK